MSNEFWIDICEDFPGIQVNFLLILMRFSIDFDVDFLLILMWIFY